MTAPFAVFLVLVGIGTGIWGTLVGVGGGFVVVPLLLFIHPGMDPSTITSISMAVIFFNALSGTFAYARMKRIDYRAGVPYAVATIPGAVLGAITVGFISREVFSIVFGVFLVGASVFLALRPRTRINVVKGNSERVVVDRWGQAHAYRTNLWAGVALSFVVGFVASLLGLGGGIMHVPVLITVLQFPVHIATATSHFVLVVTAASSGITHLFEGAYAGVWPQVLLLAAGVVPGAQIGARLSQKLKGTLIMRLLALALLLVGLRLVIESIVR